jgi:two-component system phosphate regulon sensor histidine kinase PhoR
LCPINIEGKDGLNFNGIISGGLDNPNKTNEVSAITVSSPTPYSSRITFRLYADSPYRVLLILRKMWPVLLLALFSIFCVAAIFYLTFRNWLKQKKLAEMKSDFVNSITHEFNTPLSSIIVANKSLQNERIMEDRERVLSLTAVINRQSQRLKTLFNQVLDLTLMDASNLQLEELVLEDLLEEIIQDYRLLVQNQLVTISYEKPATRHKVMLDRFWTTTMIINLLDNGIKYNNHTHKELKVFTRLNGKKLALHIADNGVGIPEDMKGLIFDKFFRSTNNMANNATNGLGLGLFYVRQCVHAHGWELDLRSKEKEGTEFIIYISLA